MLEAIVGAVYLDSGHDLSAVRKTMIALGFVEVLHNYAGKGKRETLGLVPASEICSITVESGAVDLGMTSQTVVYRTVPVSCT